MADRKKNDGRNGENKSIPLFEEANQIKSRISKVFDQISDLLFADDENGRAPALDLSTVTTSTDDSQDDKDTSFSTSGDDSRLHLPSPPRLRKSHVDESGDDLRIHMHSPPRLRKSNVDSRNSPALLPSNSSSAFFPIRRPAPRANSLASPDISFDTSSIVESSGTEISRSIVSIVDDSMMESEVESSRDSGHESIVQTNGASSETIVRFTPMARMRSNAVAQASQMDRGDLLSPPRKSQVDPEKTMADKHRKWRRQIKAAQQRKDEEKRRQRRNRTSTNLCVSTSNLLLGRRSEPARLFAQLTNIRCGTIDDALVEVFSDDFSDTSSASEFKISTPPRPIRKGPHVCSVRRTLENTDQGPKENVADYSESDHNNSSTSTKSILSQLDIRDTNFIKAFIHETSQEGYALIWHKPSPDVRNFENPVDIVAFLELGFLQEDGTFAGPRLAWYDESGKALGAIDLLDIRSLSKASPMQLRDFPFAIPGNSLILKLHNSINELVLEASSPSASRSFIHGLRWVVARLTFNLIIGNKDVCCELLEVQNSSHRDLNADMNKAMNDVTKQLVDKAAFSTPQQLV